ncbi:MULTISPECIES: hypothetical protein [unclassified Pseudomonas]|uniref:hypothetical protein n=1 Tax=unclassified Pseudomonas TaxID=196821 RepID=UPI0024468CA4|nr:MULTISPECIES: hypothetical protein [unclassified Pseudomonas]MDH0893018.1 hypothetical protein [Pseudomonas sp. GD03875]MDH1066223.1 hypothetical protein [Pseudomonas sp. GD03985]
MYGRKKPNYLFHSNDGSSALRNQISAASEDISKLPEQRVLQSDPEELISYFIQKFQIEIPSIDRSLITASHHERNIEVYDQWDKQMRSVPGEAYDFEIPFEGEGIFFSLKPSTWDFSPPHADISGQCLRLTISGRELSPEKIKESLDSFLESVEKYLVWHRQEWSGFEQQLSQAVRQSINDRREKLLKQKGVASQLSSLGIKLKEKPGDAKTYVPPAIKKTITPQLPPMRPALPPDPTLDEKQYETILSLVRGAGRSIEQSSSRARKLDEETLRDLFLVPLNSHFGKASGEAFNYQGKTDVIIRHENNNLFVAEFKIWKGEKHFLEAIDQLLSYLSWRDTKAAIIIFSRNAGFSSILEKIRNTTKAHPRYLSGPIRLDETSDRYTFSLPQDHARQATISILAFDLGSEKI